MASTTSLLTFEEFERLPDQPGKRELLKGELVELPPAESTHNRRSHHIYKALDAALAQAHAREAMALGEVWHEMGYKLGPRTYMQPDVSITHAGQPERKYFEGAPAIAIEIISPSNTAEEIDLKTQLYFEFGAREVWRVHRKTRRIIVHVPGGSREVSESEVLTTPLLPGLALPVTEILGQ